MTETILMAMHDGLADWEYGYLAARLNSPDWQLEPGRFAVRTVSPDGLAVTTMGGVRIEPDLSLDDLALDDPAPDGGTTDLDGNPVALLFLPGGTGWDAEGPLGGFARAADALLTAGTPVAAICGAVTGLAREGVLDGRRHTGNSREELAATGYAAGEDYIEAPAVTDRGLVTAGATDPAALACEVFTLLRVFSPDVVAQFAAMFGRSGS